MSERVPEFEQHIEPTVVDPPAASGQRVRDPRRSVSRRLSQVSTPVVKLLVLDEGSDDRGETIWLRRETTIVGRSGGEIVLAHDSDLSACHFQVDRVRVPLESSSEEREFQWWLRDLHSTNGTFIRVRRLELDGETELRFGQGHYLWTMASSSDDDRHQADRTPVLVSLIDHERRWCIDPGRRQTLGHASASVSIPLADDPCLDDEHAVLEPEPNAGWTLIDSGSTNGVWKRVSEILLEDGMEILAGGQRFRFLS